MIVGSRLFDHPIRSRQHIGRNRKADVLGRFEVDDEFKLLRLLHREISRLRSSENLVDIPRGATPRILTTRAVRYKTPVINKSTATIDCRQLVLSRKINYLLPAIYEEWVWSHQQCVGTVFGNGTQGLC